MGTLSAEWQENIGLVFNDKDKKYGLKVVGPSFTVPLRKSEDVSKQHDGSVIAGYIKDEMVIIKSLEPIMYTPKDAYYLFGCFSSFEVKDVELDTSNTTDFTSMFAHSGIEDLAPLANWDVSNGKDFSYMFDSCSVVDLAPLAGWNVSGGEIFNGMFYDTEVSDVAPIANWDVGNSADFYEAFGRTLVKDFSPLANWEICNNVLKKFFA